MSALIMAQTSAALMATSQNSKGESENQSRVSIYCAASFYVEKAMKITEVPQQIFHHI